MSDSERAEWGLSSDEETRPKDKKAKKPEPWTTDKVVLLVIPDTASQEEQDKLAAMNTTRTDNAKALIKLAQPCIRFEHYTDGDISALVQIFEVAGVRSVKELKKAQEEARKYLLDDLRKKHKYEYSQLKLLLDIFNQFPPPRLNEHLKKDEVAYEEINIPLRKEKWSIKLNKLEGPIAPDQEMVNWVSHELAKAKLGSKHYTPYLFAPSIQEEPWRPSGIDSAAHKKALDSWKSMRKQLSDSAPQQCSLSAWQLYTWRFTLAADLAGAFNKFGGIQAQMNKIGVILQMAVVDSVSVALAYEIAFNKYCQTLARNKTPDVDWVRLHNREHQPSKRIAMKAHPPNANPPKASSVGSKGKNKKGGKGFLAITNHPHKPEQWGKERNKKGTFGKGGKKGDKGGEKGKWGKQRWTPYPPPTSHH